MLGIAIKLSKGCRVASLPGCLAYLALRLKPEAAVNFDRLTVGTGIGMQPFCFCKIRNITMWNLISSQFNSSRLVSSALVSSCVALSRRISVLPKCRAVAFVHWITFLDVLFANNRKRQWHALCICLCEENYAIHAHTLTQTHTHTHTYRHSHVTRLLFNLWSRARKNCALWQKLQRCPTLVKRLARASRFLKGAAHGPRGRVVF